MNRAWFAGWFLLMSLSVVAQNPFIPRLRSQLARSLPDTTRSRLLVELSLCYSNENNDSCRYCIRQSLAIAHRTRDSLGLARAMYAMCHLHIHYDKNEALATRWARQGMAIALAHHDHEYVARFYWQLAIIANHQRIDNADELLTKALAYARQSHDGALIGSIYDTKADIIQPANQSKGEQAKLYKLAMESSWGNDVDLWMTHALDYCTLLEELGKSAQAMALARHINAQTHRLQQKYGRFVYVNDLARLYKLLHQYPQAESTLLKGIAAEQQRPRPDTVHLYHSYRFLVELYTRQGNWQKAFSASQRLADVRLSLQRKRQTLDSKLEMTQLKATLDLEKKERELALVLTQQKQQRLFLLGTGSMLIILAGFVIILQRSRAHIQRQQAELSGLNTNLAKLNATKDKLFAILAHDLRSPVANLQTILNLINWGALDQAEFTEAIQRLNKTIGHVQTMLDNLLYWAFSQMGGERTVAKPTAVAPVAEEQLALLRPPADSKAVQLINEIAPDAVIRIDPNHLAIIVRNLLQNAVKFTRTGDFVRIASHSGPGYCTIQVSDSGVGMDADTLANLFNIDRRSSQPGTAHEQGVGLGMMLVDELVRGNGGTLTVTSQPGVGTQFSLTFASASPDTLVASPDYTMPGVRAEPDA